MTVTKESLREALSYYDAKNGPHANSRMLAAARFTERLLPETCKTCGGVGTEGGTIQADPFCHGNGQLWDEGLVEVVAEALHDAPYDGCDSYQQMQVRAVLAALTAEVGK